MIAFLAPMLAGKGAKILLYVVILAAIGGTIFAGYRWVVGMQDTIVAQAQAITIHEANEAALEATIAAKEAHIAEVKAARQAAVTLGIRAKADMEKARERQGALEAKLAKYDLVKHASRHPKALEKAMERATKRVFDEFEALANQS